MLHSVGGKGNLHDWEKGDGSKKKPDKETTVKLSGSVLQLPASTPQHWLDTF